MLKICLPNLHKTKRICHKHFASGSILQLNLIRTFQINEEILQIKLCRKRIRLNN